MTATRSGIGVGVARPRSDSEAKVRGGTRYAADRPVGGLLHARLVLAPDARARIRTIETAPALASTGVVAVLIGTDLAAPDGTTDRLTEPLARSEVVFAGQPIALVVATSPAAAADAAELVAVDLEPLPAVLDPLAAMTRGARLVRSDAAPGAAADEHGPATGAATHAAIGGEGDRSIEAEALSPNVVERTRYRIGDVGHGLATGAATVTARFETAWVHQGYLETQACTAWLEDDGTIVVESGTQGIFALRSDVARVLGLPLDRVRVVATPLGGAFGGKWALFEPLVALAAQRLRRPVRLVLDRREDFSAANPSEAFTLDLEAGAAADGTFTALRARIVADAGAFADYTASSIAPVLLAGPYRWPAVDLSAYGVRTNRFGTGTYRAPSAPPAAFAIESVIDELAGRLGLDPVAVRRRNLAVEGDAMVDGEAWPRLGSPEVLDRLEADERWRTRDRSGPDEGVGLALGWWPASKAPAAALCRMSSDGTVDVVTGVVDMSGTNGAFQAIVSEVLGISPDAVRVVTADTSAAPPSPGSGGSAITYGAGPAVRAAAEDVRRQLLRAAARRLEIAESDLELVAGHVRPIGTPERAISLHELAQGHAADGRAPIEGHASTEHATLAPSAGGAVAHVRVDRSTGEVTVLELVAVQDVGRALNPALVTGQQLGGAAQSVGWALREALIHDDHGQLLTGTFLDYALPRAADLPSVHVGYVEVPAPEGPFGAKGIGETAVVAGAAAIANAVAAATGRRPRQLPMTAPRVWRLLDGG